MNTLVVFYSLEGNTKIVADILAEELDSDCIELKPDKEIPKGGFTKFFWGGKSILFHEKPNLLNDLPDIDEYDTIFIGTPIWASSYTPPIASFLEKVSIKGKKLALFACHAGGGAEKCFEKLKSALSDNTIIGTISFTDPAKEEKEKIKAQLKHWLHEIT
ncbi:Flavodoxin [Anaerocolumna jejuensis DSM 15929]|uniref:Flavodoxin n=1 Tax=Anaerocolumna jejuensis DSM 15929 TaxID=1121322 RepID=A0A1M6NQ97_9FIRM|nr:flavodoxin [Anaerocolumna jejuensis]SHJ97875.1 Flavodoxin [Anaerocolumna jejuensis DSM 15929]